MEQPRQLLDNETDLDLNSTGDKLSWTIPFQMKIADIGVVIKSADAGGATVKFDRRPTAGDDTSRGDGDVGIITIPASNQIGKVLYEKEAASADLVLNAGDEIVVEVTAENVSANAFFRPFVEYYRLAENKANDSDSSAA